MATTEIRLPFRPRARLLQLLGNELIGSPRLAVFELVKNAYDADANEVDVEFNLQSKNDPMISVTDDGEGMSLEVLRSVWLVPGDDFRRKQRDDRSRSRKHNRLPLGEKGLGRFAVHKLGNRIRLITRATNCEECVVEIDWNDMIAQPYLDEAPVKIGVRSPEVFTGMETGTRVEIRELRPPAWTRGEVRRLHTQITSICSPFSEPGEFRAVLSVPGNESWIEALPDLREVLGRANWRFSFELDAGRFDWSYEFRQIPGFNLNGRQISKVKDSLQLPAGPESSRRNEKVVADESTTCGIGPVSGEFYVFDRGREVLQRMGDSRLLTSYLDENGGIRVYRDGIRVYNYGERGDDWLGLDLRRVNVPTQKISRNIILGAVHLSLESSDDLIEMTNREGFVENEACNRLRQIVLGAVGTLEAERRIDKERIRRLTEKPSDPTIAQVDKPIQQLRQALVREDVVESFEPYVAKIEQDYLDMQETLLAAGMSGLNLAVVFHEVDRGVRALHRVIVDGSDMERADAQAKQLVRVLDGFSTLLRRDSKKIHRAHELVALAKRFNNLRIKSHHVQFRCPIFEDESHDFRSTFSLPLVLGALSNLFDNALYWLRVRWPELCSDGKNSSRQLYVGTTLCFDHGPAIVVADNGTGFQGDPPDHLVRPFYTRKPDGMGLGLYYANLAMELNGGYLAFPSRSEVDVPDEFDGAVVAMVFQGRS